MEIDVQRIAPLDIPMVNMQVETANKYPRQDLAVISRKVEDMLKKDPDLASMCYYNKPAGKDKRTGQMKYVQGGSVRLAEIVASEYGNLLVQVDTQETPSGVVGMCRAFDAQKNFAVQAPVKRAFTSEREQARQNTFNAAVSIAYRNGIFKVVPKAVCEKLWKIAAEITEKGLPAPDAKRGKKKRDEKIQALLDAWAGRKVTQELLESYLMIPDINEITPKQFKDLQGLWRAITDGDVDIHEVFQIRPDSGGSTINERTEVLSEEEAKKIEDVF
jgi:hypothetical protein